MADGERQTGRTTRMLLAACIAVSEGKDVLLVGYDAHYSKQLYRRLCELLDGIGIPRDPQQKIWWKSAFDEMPADAMEIFVDHFAREPS